MKKLKSCCYGFLLIITFLCFKHSASGQSNEIKVRFIGNCGLHLYDGNADIYIDFPYKSGAYNYMEYDKVELSNVKENGTFIFTHKHADHYSRKLLKRYKGKKYGPWNVAELENLKNFNT